MRIIGGHDYYDSGLAYGRDDDIMFVRDGKEFKAKDAPLKWHNKAIFNDDRWFSDMDSGAHEAKVAGTSLRRTRFHRSVTVYAANKVFYGVEVKDLHDFETVFWHYDKLEEYAVENQLKIAVPQHWDRRWVNDTTVKDRFTPRELTREELDWMVDNRVAIAVGYMANDEKEKRVWHCNNAKEFALKNFRFQRAVDPYTMFQELSMFVGNWPKEGNPAVTITDDKVKVAKHGFDKWSFRRHADDN